MREFEHIIDEAFKIGLRPHHANPRNSPGLVELKNARVTVMGLEPFEDLTNLTTKVDLTGDEYHDPAFVTDDDYVLP